jgi:hypothetical protein
MHTIDLDQLAAVIGGQNHATSATTPPGQDPKPLTTQAPPAQVDCETMTDPIKKFYCRGGM